MKKVLPTMTAALLIAALGSSAVFAAKATSWKLYAFKHVGPLPPLANGSGHQRRRPAAMLTVALR
jgi:hypothetical protein